MRFSYSAIWQNAAVFAALLPILVSASPLLPQKRQDNNFKECMDRNGKRYFLYNKKGVPGPNDLKVATEHDGKPNDLTTLAVLRAMVELDPAHIEWLIHVQDGEEGKPNATNAEWVSSDSDCGKTDSDSAGQEEFVHNGLIFDATMSPLFQASQLQGFYDNAEGSIWPLIVQDQMTRSIDVDHTALYPNLVQGPQRGVLLYTHNTFPNPQLRQIAEDLWKRAGNDNALATTDKVADQTDTAAWVDQILKNTKDQSTPCLLATNADVQGEGFAGETVYTVGFAEDGSVLARDVQKLYSDEPLKLTSELIAQHVAYITYFDVTESSSDDQ